MHALSSFWRARFSACLFFALGTILPGPCDALAARKSGAEPDIFSTGYVAKVQIELPRQAILQLRRNPRAYVSAVVRENDRTYTNVAIHLKGSVGSFRAVEANPSLTLNFDKLNAGQNFHGFDKIHLNNSVQDPTLLSEKIARDMFNQAGIPTPRATHATVRLNGSELGVYVLVEGINKKFLKKHFESAKGNLYDGVQAQDIGMRLSKNSGERDNDWSDLRAVSLAAAAEISTRRARLERVLDLDRFITLMAMEVMIWHWDGYALNRNNYRVYHDPGSHKMVFLPHGLDQAFRMTEGPILPQMKGQLARAVMEVPELRQAYRQRMSELLTNVFRSQEITNEASHVALRLEKLKREQGGQAADIYHSQVDDFLLQIARRARSVERQFARPSKPLLFDSSGKATLAGWRPKVDVGTPIFNVETNAGRRLLQFRTSEATVCSWRTQVLLEPGFYRLVGKVRTRAVTPNPSDPRGGGVSLRLSGMGGHEKLAGTRDWTEMSFEFPVTDNPGAVELVCEFRALAGEVWFDEGSLQLRRVGSPSANEGKWWPFR